MMRKYLRNGDAIRTGLFVFLANDKVVLFNWRVELKNAVVESED